jgi:hypothetical protein
LPGPASCATLQNRPPLDWERATARAEHVAAIESEVSEWVWATNAAWERLEPIWDERHGRRPNPRRLRGRPERKADAELYGFDAAGQMVVSRRFGDGFGNDDVIRSETLRVGERLFVYATEGARGVYRHRLAELRVPTYADGLLVRLDTSGPDMLLLGRPGRPLPPIVARQTTRREKPSDLGNELTRRTGVRRSSGRRSPPLR